MAPSPETARDEDLPLPFGRFTLVSILGRGGMGRVFKAVMTGPSGFRKEVALKVISGADPHQLDAVRAGLGDEARIGALLSHPHILDVYDFGEDDGLPWISMELVQGLDLAEIGRRTRLAPAHVVRVGMAVAAGLDHAHALHIDGRPAGLVHRDLKPSNVLVSRDGVVKVMDFGIAKLTSEGHRTETGIAKGTPAYMAPEQAAAEEIDGRADLWSLGAMLWELATGEPLLSGATVIEVIMQLMQLPERLAQPGAFEAVDAAVPGLGPIVARLLQTDVDRRYARADEVEADLDGVLGGLPGAPSLRAVVRDLLAGGDALALSAPKTRPLARRVGLSATVERAAPTNLGPDTSSFLGRTEDLAALREQFTAGRLVTLLGPGGTGKTRLAREFARSYLPEVVEGGVWFVPLDDARGVDGILHAVGSALALPLSKGATESQLDRIGASLAGRGALLLVLDNFEQVVALAPQTVGRWLAQAPRLRTLVTSREVLRIDGEHVLPLGPLEREAAVALFIDRSRAARRGFSPSDEEQGVIGQIVDRLDRIPLAIELAASRAAVLPPAKLLDRLSQRFRLLRGGARGTSARQATLEGAIGWSWDLLGEAERWTLAWCSVFRGGFGLEQAEALIDLERFDGAPWVLDVVESLRDKSLLRTWEGVRGVRFGMFESIREFGAKKLTELGARADAQRRHAEVMVAFAEERRDDVYGPRANETHDELAEELENLAAAIEHAKESGEALLQARLVIGTEPLLRRRGPAEYNRRILADARRHLDGLPAAQRAMLHAAWSTAQRLAGQTDEGLETAWAAVRAAEETGDAVLAAKMSIGLGHSLRGPEGADAVIRRMHDALTEVRARGDRALEGFLLSSLSLAVGWAGDAREERRLHNEALALHREAGNARMVGAEAGNIAIQCALDGELDEAEQWMLEAYEAFRNSFDHQAVQITLGNLASLYVELDRRDEADRALRRALEAARRLGISHFVPLLTCNRGLLQMVRGDTDGALAFFAEAEVLYRDVDVAAYHEGMLEGYWGLALLFAGDAEAARARMLRGLALYAKARMPRDLGLGYALLAAAEAARGDEDAALAALETARGYAEETDQDDLRLAVGFGEGHVELLRARRARAAGAVEDADLLDELVEARLDMLRLDTVRPAMVRLARRLLEEAAEAGTEATVADAPAPFG